MEFLPIVLNGKIAMVNRADLLFCYCGTCEQMLSWKPSGSMTFSGNCCRTVYTAIPASMDLWHFQIVRQDANMENVRLLKPKLKVRK